MERKYKVEEITPKNSRCGVGACPAIYSTEEHYILRGTREDLRTYGIAKAGEDEVDIRVPKSLIDNMKK